MIESDKSVRFGEEVADKVKEKCGLDVWINTICPTIGAHSGPGTVALFFMGEKRL